MPVFVGGLKWRRVSLVVVDHLLIVLAVLVAVALRLGPNVLISRGYWWRAVLVAVIVQMCLHYCDFYDVRTLRHRRDIVISLLQGLGASLFILALLYYWLPVLTLGRGTFLGAGVLIVLVLAGWRVTFEWLSGRLGPTERLLIVGASNAAMELGREIFDRRHELGVELVGFVDSEARAQPGPGPTFLGTIDTIPQIVRGRHVDRVVVSLGDARGKLSMDKLLEIKLNEGVRFDHLASVYEEYTGKIAIENLRPSWLVFSEGFRKTTTLLAIKRVFDLVLASIGLLILLPVLLIVAFLNKLLSPGPALYSQVRVGQNGRPFVVYKFRSMRPDAESKTGAVWASPDDPRVTPVGRVLRRTRLDELPQLWNVLRGDMSFVGPRPERPEFVSALTEQIPYYGQRHVVRPGLTGWAQIRHRYGGSVDDAVQKLQYDLYYVKHISIAFDAFIVLETLKTVMVRKGS